VFLSRKEVVLCFTLAVEFLSPDKVIAELILLELINALQFVSKQRQQDVCAYTCEMGIGKGLY